MKIVYVTDRPFYKRDYHRFGLDYFENHEYEIEIWRVLYPHCLVDLDISDRLYRKQNYYEIKCFDLTKKLLENCQAIYYIHNIKADYSLRVMKSGNRYFAVDAMGVLMQLPDHQEQQKDTFRKRVKKRIEIGVYGTYRNFINRLKSYYHNRDWNKTISCNPPEFVITSTVFAAKVFGLLPDLMPDIVYTHSYDYDRFLEAKSYRELKRCIVFCDSGYYDHDYDFEEKYGEAATSKSSSPWSGLGVLFDKLEEHYKIPVVIAGHPHTKYSDNHPTGRPIVFDRVAELTKNAEIFVLNTSTALSIAILNDKPILQVVSREFRSIVETPELSLYDFITWQARSLGSGLIDIDNIEEIERPWEYVRRVSDDKRQEYISKYIIDNDTEDRLVVEYIDDILRNRYRDEVCTGE